MALGCPVFAQPQLHVSVAAVAPDTWLSCSDDCKLAWVRKWVSECTRKAPKVSSKPVLVQHTNQVTIPHFSTSTCNSGTSTPEKSTGSFAALPAQKRVGSILACSWLRTCVMPCGRRGRCWSAQSFPMGLPAGEDMPTPSSASVH